MASGSRGALLVMVVTLISGVLFQLRHQITQLNGSHLAVFLGGALVIPILKFLFFRILRASNEETKSEGSSSSIYGLDHGRLHVKLPLPMWMNMGFWKSVERNDKMDMPTETRPKSLAVASRAMLSEVLKTAGFDRERDDSEKSQGKRQSKALLDLGFGCGDQTIYLTSPVGVRSCDDEWWDLRLYVPLFDSYVGITLDKKQYQCAQSRVEELQRSPSRISEDNQDRTPNIRLFCANAARPDAFDDKVAQHLLSTFNEAQEPWVLALDTLYHFSPSRWPIINFASGTLDASFMGFDLCIADNISFPNLIILCILTKLMGAPWANFITQDQYHRKLIEAGYQDVTLKDISEDVFGPLAMFLSEQDWRLRVIGYSLGPFHLARWMFKWWGQTGIVRGVIVVAKK